jgi:diguanylate cyclase (GGDEF)-like protein
MNPSRIPTIRSRLILLVMACVVPTSLVVATLIALNYYHDHAALGQASKITARAMMSVVDAELAGVQGALLALSTSPSLQTGDLATFYRQAKSVLETQAAINIVLLDRTFQQRVNTLRPYGSALPLEKSPSQQLKQVFITGRSVTTDIFIGPVTKKPFIAVAVPVYRDGIIVYVLAAGIEPDRLAGLLSQQNLSADWIGVILDSSGTIVARTHQMERFIGTKGAATLLQRMAEVPEDAFENVTREGIPVLAAYSKSATTNWTLALGIPVRTLTNELVITLWWFVDGTTLLLLCSLAVAFAIANSIALPIHKLVAPALALGSGEEVTVQPLQLKEAEEVGQALTRASLMLMEAQHRSNHDPLTGLANRALFDKILSHQFAICKRAKTSLAIVYVDLDGFKQVNDANGHAAGDEMLCIVATRLRNAIRESDLAARLGGDEFGLILAHADLAAAKIVAAKLIKSLSGPYPIGEHILQISASIGIAVYPESGTTIEALTAHADEAMYKAKAAGKHCYAA